MKPGKKLLHSALILGVTLGNLNGTVVQAVSALSTIKNETKITKATETTKESEPTIKKASKSETKKATSKTKNKNSTKTNKQSLDSKETEIVRSKRTLKADSNFNVNDFPRYTNQKHIDLAKNLLADVQTKLNEFVDTSSIRFELGEQVQANQFMYSFPEFSSYNGGRIGVLLKYPNGLPIDEYWASVESDSGNWEMRLYTNHINSGQGFYDFLVNATFKRLKYGASNSPEKFTFPAIPFTIFEYNDNFNLYLGSLEKESFTVKFPTAEDAIGKIKATVKSGTHGLIQNDPVPDPKNYLTVENTKGNVKYEWTTSPKMDQLGTQNAKVRVSDETGRAEEVTVPVTVEPLIKAKTGPFEIYQYDLMPKAEDYFEVTSFLTGDYSIDWIDNANTNTPGTQTWRAKITASNNREATAEIPMQVKPLGDLVVKLKPIEEHKLGYSYPSFATNFKEYIDSVTMNGANVELKDLEYVPAESVEPDSSVVGTHPVKLTVQTKHPNSGATIKGSVETTVNVKWGETILMKAFNGESAGAFSLLLNGTNSSNIPLKLTSGLKSSPETSVGPSGTPFSLYYSFEVLRNEQVIYSQDVPNRATLEQIMDDFGGPENTIDVRINDVIKIYHPERTPNSSVLMMNEQEHDFTYDSEYAYYKVTAYGFDPVPVMEAEGAQKSFVLGENTANIDPSSLISNVTINGQKIDSSLYTVESLIDFDTSAVGTRKMRLRIKMKDGLASKDFDIDYQVKWGSTFVLKGLDNATVGAFSLLKENNQWALHASPGISDTDLSKPVNNYFGRKTYYGIEVIENVTTKYQYEVPGNISIKEAIEGFNNGQPLNVEKGNVIKVYHAESSGKNLLMVDELVKDFTIGSDYAYYEVTDHGLEPILAIDTDTKPQEFQLGEDTSKVDGTQLINHLTINGTEVPATLYTVKQLADFDTQTVGDKELRIQIETKDGNISKEIGVPYEVKWGNSIVMKSSTGGSAGVYSLQPGSSNTSRRLKIHQGFDSPLDEKLGQDPGLYYSLTVLRDDREVYAQDMPGHATLQQIMTAFGTDQVVSIQLGDVVKVYHPQRSEGSSVLMVDEKEEDFTYGSPYAYYQVTAYGFEPMSVMEAHTANQAFVLGEDISQIEDSQLLEKVTINGETVPEDAYTIERLSALDTTTIGKKTVKMKVRMNDGLSVVETEIPYEVKWGSTFVLKGLEEATVGAFSILKQNETLAIYASKGETTTDMDAPVNYTFGRDTYYKIEVLADPKKKQLFPDNIKYSYEVAGNRTVRQAIQGFNNGQPLVVEEGDIFKIYHAETENRNLLMRDDLVKDYTAGLNYAYYQVKNDEFEPITMLEAEVSSQELILGEDASKLDAATLLGNVSFNGQKLANTLYKVEQTEAFDTHTTGQKTVNLKVTTADGVSSTDIEVPYEVKWGSTIHLKNRKGETVGSFGLLKNEKQKQIEIQSMQGSDQTVLKNRVTELDDMNVYYGIEVLTSANVSKYKYEVRGTQTIEQAISRFNSGKGLIVNEGDVIRVFHSDSNNNLLMSEERERNFTYGGKYAIYKVTEYGFEPSGELTVTPHTVKIVQGAKKVDLKSLVKEVKVNGKNVPSNFYNVTLSEEVEKIDTSKLGENSIPIDVTVDPTFGGFTTQTQTTYEVVEEGTEGAQGPENTGNESNDGASDANNTTGNGTGDSSNGLENVADIASKLPQTNSVKNAAMSAIGAVLVGGIGSVFFWKKRKSKENQKKDKN